MTMVTAPERVHHHSGHDCSACRRANRLRCDGSGRDYRCGERGVHRHCACGLAMPPDAELCDMCLMEGAEYTDYDEMLWDGVSYGSLRRRRTMAPNTQLYEALFWSAHERAAILMKALGGWKS